MSKNKLDQVPVVFIFNVDESITTVTLDKFNSKIAENAEFILFPNNDDPTYLICEKTKYLDIKEATIKTEIVNTDASLLYAMSDYAKGEIEEADITNYLDMYAECYGGMKTDTFKVTTAYEFYLCLWNVIKLKAASLLLYDIDYDVNCTGLCMFSIDIEVVLKDGTTESYHWSRKHGRSVQTNMLKLSADICKLYGIPEKYLSTSKTRHDNSGVAFRIRNNSWKLISDKKINDDDLVGRISLLTTTAMFSHDTIIDKLLNITDTSVLEFELSSVMTSYIESLQPDYLQNSTNLRYLQLLDYGDIVAGDSIVFTNILSLEDDKLTFLSNIHYLYKYTRGLLCALYDIPLEETSVFVMLGYSGPDGRKTETLFNEFTI